MAHLPIKAQLLLPDFGLAAIAGAIISGILANRIPMQQFAFPYQQSLKTQLTLNIQTLITAAEMAAEKAYAANPTFKTGAALVRNDGTILAAACEENADFPAGSCAERNLLDSIDISGSNKIIALAIAYKTKSNGSNPPLSPCGSCRQAILEAQLKQQYPIAVYMTSPDGEVIMIEDASFLLPFYVSRDQQ